VYIKLPAEVRNAFPNASSGGIHELKKASHAIPNDHEVGIPVGQPDDRDRRQCRGLANEKVVDRQYALRRFQSQVASQLFDRVDRCAVYVGLASVSEAFVAHINAEAL
jgi:hypothetical protein